MRIAAIIILVCASGFAQEKSPFAGDWKGDSICATASAGCHNEKVVWHVPAAPGPTGRLAVRGERLESGRTVVAHSLNFQADAESKALVSKSSQGTWRITVDGNRMEGTLTRANNTVIRRLALRRSDGQTEARARTRTPAR